MDYEHMLSGADIDGNIVFPPFGRSDFVRLKRPGGGLGNAVGVVERLKYLGQGNWRVEIDGWSYPAEDLKKAFTTDESRFTIAKGDTR